jgi:hypothetical protein
MPWIAESRLLAQRSKNRRSLPVFGAEWGTLREAHLNLEPRIAGLSMLEMLQDHGHWPDGTASLPNDCDATFTALGIPIMLDDLRRFALPNTNTRPSSWFLSGAAINFALASLAADFNNHPELHQMSHDTAAVPPHFSGLSATEGRIQFMIERLADCPHESLQYTLAHLHPRLQHANLALARQLSSIFPNS